MLRYSPPSPSLFDRLMGAGGVMTESRARDISLSWGDGIIDLALPRPNLGSLLLVEQDKQEFRGVLLRMVADELVAGRPVHWIDGGMGFDPSPLLPLLRIRGCFDKTALRRFHICRGFTAHQTAAIIARLADEASASEPPNRLSAGRLIITSNLARMFMDTQLKRAEGRSLLRGALTDLRRLCSASESLLIITSRRHSSPPMSKDLRALMISQVDDRLSVIPAGRGSHRRGISSMRLHLASVDRSITWARLPQGQTSLLDFRHIHASRHVCIDEPPLIISSFQPKGESRALAARMASGV